MRLTPEQLSARNRRNVRIAGGLAVFIVLIFVTTVLRLHQNIETSARENAERRAATAEAAR